MNKETKDFVNGLKKDSNVLGVVLFGSWARGSNRIGSDVDILVILKEGYKRTIEYLDNQAFEIIYSTKKEAFDFWKSNRDDAAGFWEDANILYDVGGVVASLKKKKKKILKEGKKEIDKFRKEQLMFELNLLHLFQLKR